MKMDRRHFLSLGIGAAAGLALSPLPWKLADDIAIWTQNWPWTPVPKDGALSLVHSTCTLCPGGCGITVRKVGDRGVTIEGRAGHPVNDGGLCLLGVSGLQLLYGPTRIRTPLKRIGKRGEGKWAPISWDRALSETASALKDLKNTGKPHAAAAILGKSRGTVPIMMKRFLASLGSSQVFSMPESWDLYGKALPGGSGRIGMDVEHADFLLGFGSGILEGWNSPVRMARAVTQLREKGRFVQVEPRLSATAAMAHEWVAVAPGTEGVLALGLSHVILREGLARGISDSGGGREFKALVLGEYAPAAVSAAVGISKERIETLARAFAGARRPLALAGSGSDGFAVQSLNALMGRMNASGGVCLLPEPDYMAGLEPASRDGFVPLSADRFSAAVKTGAIQALLVAGADPACGLPDTGQFQEALDAVPLVVSFSSYMDETALQADLILPDHHYLEKLEDVPGAAGFPSSLVGLTRPVVPPVGDTRHVGDTIIALARAMGGKVSGALPWKDYDTCLKTTFGAKWATLMEKGYLGEEKNGGRNPASRFGFPTDPLGGRGLSAPFEGDPARFPLVLLPFDTLSLNSGYGGTPPFAAKILPDTLLKGALSGVEINPETAKALRLADGAKAVLSTPKGSAQVAVTFSDGIPPGGIFMPRGLGGKTGYLSGKGVNVNALLGSDPRGIRASLSA